MAHKSKASRIVITRIIIATAYFSLHWMGQRYGWIPSRSKQIAEKTAEQERAKQAKQEFEKLITENTINTHWQIKDEWKRLIANKRIIVVYSKERLYTAVEIVQRLRLLSATVSYDIASEISFNGQPYYWSMGSASISARLISAELAQVVGIFSLSGNC